MTHTANSLVTGRTIARKLRETAERPPALVITYLTVNHDQAGLLAGLSEELGPDVPVIGCSTQGVVSRGSVREEGYAAGAVALGGEGVSFSRAVVEQIREDSTGKGQQLGRALKAGLPALPSVVVLHYDALCGVDPDRFLEGLFREVECPIVGGAAAHSFSFQALRETYVYDGRRVLTGAAVAFAICGDFGFEIGLCHGCSPTGVELVVTRSEANRLLELDGRRAADVWQEICGDTTPMTGQVTALAIGVPRSDASEEYFVRSAYQVDPETGAVVLGPAIPTGTRIMLHHRTVEDVLQGARSMGESLVARIGARPVRAVLGFECGARTRPFLGDEATLQENLELQRRFEDAAWIGMLPWGELVPVDGRPAFHNYGYSVLALTD
jgi:hypothetical protein